MALIKCKECDKEVSDKAKACPHCGAEIPRTSAVAKIFAWTIGILVLFSIIGSCSGNKPTATSSTTRPANVVASSEQYTGPKPQENTTSWDYSEHEDAISGKKYDTASTKSINTVQLNFPYQGGTYGEILIRSHPRWGKDVIFIIDKGQFVCSAGSGCNVAIKIDDKPPFQVSASLPEDYSSTTLFLGNSASLIKKIKSGKKMVVAANLYKEGQPAFEFDIAGLEWK